MRRIVLVGVAVACLLAGCGTTPSSTITPSRGAQCSTAAAGRGVPGACAPRSFRLPPTTVAPAGLEIVDLSDNNSGTWTGAALKAAGFVGEIDKINQSGYGDPDAKARIASARAAGLVVGGYDFDATYTIQEARTFVSTAEADGLEPGARGELPLALDCEWVQPGYRFTVAALQAQVRYIESQGFRVDIYTGNWWWEQNAGSFWPVGAAGWISGYPDVIWPAALPAGLRLLHQWTDVPEDRTVFLGSTSQWEALTNTVPVPAPKPHPTPEPKPSPKPAPIVKPKIVVCWGPGATPRSTACRAIFRQHTFLVARRIHWGRVARQHQAHPRSAVYRHAEHWCLLRRAQAANLRKAHTA